MFFSAVLRMKLLTHNMLTSHVRGVKNGYPLKILAKQVVVNKVDFNAEFVARMIPKLDWSVLKAAAVSVGEAETVPDAVPDGYETNSHFLKTAHRAMLEVEVVEGELECPESGRRFPVSEGIPNMLLREDEV